jgi:hypothetical protein
MHAVPRSAGARRSSSEAGISTRVHQQGAVEPAAMAQALG